jgi:Na+-transporting NADH:ubiquinone oxidoreductase subunit A
MTTDTIIHLRRGFDIHLEGEPAQEIQPLPLSNTVDVAPPDFKYLTPKLMVEEGEGVMAGQALFVDKHFPQIRFCAPVSGIVSEIVRGEKRVIQAIRIHADKDGIQYVDFPKESPKLLTADTVRERILESGCWGYILQRPFNCIADPTTSPRAIFISCFDTAPLAPQLDFIMAQEPESFQTGLEALVRLGGGCPVHLGLPKNQTHNIIGDTEGVSVHRFSGPHPAGNVGIQIHHIDPIRHAQDVVWTLHPQDVMIIGRLFNEGRYRADRLVAVGGAKIKHPRYYKVLSGQRINGVLEEHLWEEKHRVIEGNVLHGRKISDKSHISFYANQITVLPEGDEPEFLGWLLPSFKKLSLSRTFFSWLFKNKKFDLDTNTHGEERPFVMTGQYEQVLPMNILPVQLLKAILAKDIERMEQLGIYEVAEEDFALCEFVCTSKIDVQNIITQGLELMREES